MNFNGKTVTMPEEMGNEIMESKTPKTKKEPQHSREQLLIIEGL